MRKVLTFILIFSLAFCLAVNVYAADVTEIVVDGVSFPVIYKTGTGEYNLLDRYTEEKLSNPNLSVYVWRKSNGTYSLLRCSDFLYVSNDYLVSNSEVQVDYFNLVNGYWEFDFSDTYTNAGTRLVELRTFIFSSDDVYSLDGNVYKLGNENFIPALPVQVMLVTGEQMKVTAPALGGTMKTLVLCGVGLMASLVVLKLFGKKSLLSLRK